jgi:alpha-L-rhamnosidase
MYHGIQVNEDSMPMFISIEEFCYGALAGIVGPAYHGPRVVAPGFRRIRIRPCVVGDLTSAAARIRTVRGVVGVDWKRSDSGLNLKAVVPVNARAKISVPKAGLRDVVVEESGQRVWEKGAYAGGRPGLSAASDEPDYVTFDAGSGTYDFSLRGAK